jgi:hypothetical protein
MKSLDFIEQLDNQFFFDEIIDVIHRNGETAVARVMWATVVTAAAQSGITLVDAATFDYEPVLENIYNTSEKGLS